MVAKQTAIARLIPSELGKHIMRLRQDDRAHGALSHPPVVTGEFLDGSAGKRDIKRAVKNVPVRVWGNEWAAIVCLQGPRAELASSVTCPTVRRCVGGIAWGQGAQRLHEHNGGIAPAPAAK